MNKETILTIMLALVALAGQAQETVWNDVVMGYANAPIIKVNRVAMYAMSYIIIRCGTSSAKPRRRMPTH